MTLSDEIFEKLAKDIFSGALEPGRRLDEPSVCRKFAVSRTPVREALRRLSGAGLVEATPNRGVAVVRVDVKQLTEMFEALAEFEGLCARLCAGRMTALEKKQLEIVNASREVKILDGEQNFAMLNSEFHESIYLGSHSPSIAGVTRSFRQRLAPFQALQFVPHHTEYSLREHDEITQAIMASEPERAYVAMRDHVVSAGVQVIDHFSKRGERGSSKSLAGASAHLSALPG
jgi:DNA-binding GntR family transcriptional regulator